MEVQFFYNTSDGRAINKTLVNGASFVGVPRDVANVMRPVIDFEDEGIFRYNYAYIPEFERYYDIVDRTATRDGFWTVSFAVDVLMSFRTDIGNLSVVIDKQSDYANGDEYIDDSSLVTDNMTFVRAVEYPDGFNDTAEYILIVAG